MGHADVMLPARSDAIGPNFTNATVTLPIFHPGQVRAFQLPGKRKALRCGRRWGKNVFGETIACNDAINNRIVGWFAPENKRLSESYNTIVNTLDPIKKRSSKNEGVIETITGGKVEFWTLEDENAGRSRKYHRVIMDEIAFTKANAIEVFERSIEPTLVDYDGSVLVMSNTNGIDPTNFMWQVCNEKKHGFVDFHAPTTGNPLIPLRKNLESYGDWMGRREKFFAELKAKKPPLVYQQEYEAKFVDWSGDAFFNRESFLVNGQPVEIPARCETVFAVIDTATKTGLEHDGTGVVYFAVIRNPVRPVGADGTLGPEYHMVILDWDIRQIEGALLETWLPTVFQNLQHWALKCKALMGSSGALIEDKNSGSVLIQQANNRGWPARAIESELTALGKDARAISVSGYIYQGLVKICRDAYEKVTTFKETTQNHLMSQVVGFRVGDKAAAKRADDLADCLTYGCAVTFGNSEGF